MNVTCKHCGKQLPANDYRQEMTIRTVMGPKLYNRWLEKHFYWEGVNKTMYVCDDCSLEIQNFINNDPYKRIKKKTKECNCPDCSLDIATCAGCPRYRNKVE